jgi:hypothetical protein
MGEGSTSVEAVEKVGLSCGEPGVMSLEAVVLAFWDGILLTHALSAWG